MEVGVGFPRGDEGSGSSFPTPQQIKLKRLNPHLFLEWTLNFSNIRSNLPVSSIFIKVVFFSHSKLFGGRFKLWGRSIVHKYVQWYKKKLDGFPSAAFRSPSDENCRSSLFNENSSNYFAYFIISFN